MWNDLSLSKSMSTWWEDQMYSEIVMYLGRLITRMSKVQNVPPDIKVTKGIVSSVPGKGDDSGQFQMVAPVRQGAD